MYSVPQSKQLFIFLCALGLGFLLGIIYDLLRGIRLSVTKSNIAVVVFDILYFFILGVATFTFILSFNKGEIRLYILGGELIGGLFYYFSFGLTAIKITNKFAALLRKLYSLIFKILSAPFRLIFKLFYRIFKKISGFLKKSRKNKEKIKKKHLPKLRLYVYNLFGILLAGKKNKLKGGNVIGKGSKKEKEIK